MQIFQLNSFSVSTTNSCPGGVFLETRSISFLIAQHAYMQGYACIWTLFDAIVMKKEVNPINYMPIELISRENIDFYRRENIG